MNHLKIWGRLKKNKGQFLVEFVVTIGLAAVVLPAILTGFVFTRSGRAQHEERLRAIELVKESSEAVRVVKEANWSFIENNGVYHPERSSSTWVLVSSSIQIDGYTLSIQIDDAFRNNGAIVESGGEIDPSTKKITISASWFTPIPSSVSEVMYLSRYKNLSRVTTTAEEFERGSLVSTVVVNNLGGEVILGAGGSGSWCSPNLSIAAIDLPKQGVANAVSSIEGQVVAGTGENASGVSFARINVSNTNPPVGVIAGEYSGFKTNDVFNEQNFAYIATDTNFKEVEIIDTQTTPYSESGYFDAPGNGDGDSVFVAGNIGYMTSADKLYTFDLSSKSGSRPQLGSITLNGVGRKIVVIGNYVYVAVDSTSTQLQIIEISNNGATLQVVGQASLSAQAGISVFVNSSSTRAYVATRNSENEREMFIIDVSTKTGNRPVVSSYDSNGMGPKGITVVPGAAILVGENGEEYQVVNISNEQSLLRCGGLEISSGIRGVSSVLESDGDAYSYIVTGDANAELKIIEGGPGGQLSSSGEYESEILDVTSSSFFNRISSNFQEPALTDIKFQVAIADPVDGSCTGGDFVYVGPDKTSNTYFETAGAIPDDNDQIGYENPARCFRFKAFYSTLDPLFTPTLYDVTVNYSP